jgi:hypothetical protein
MTEAIRGPSGGHQGATRDAIRDAVRGHQRSSEVIRGHQRSSETPFEFTRRRTINCVDASIIDPHVKGKGGCEIDPSARALSPAHPYLWGRARAVVGTYMHSRAGRTSAPSRAQPFRRYRFHAPWWALACIREQAARVSPLARAVMGTCMHSRAAAPAIPIAPIIIVEPALEEGERVVPAWQSEFISGNQRSSEAIRGHQEGGRVVPAWQ